MNKNAITASMLKSPPTVQCNNAWASIADGMGRNGSDTEGVILNDITEAGLNNNQWSSFVKFRRIDPMNDPPEHAQLIFVPPSYTTGNAIMNGHTYMHTDWEITGEIKITGSKYQGTNRNRPLLDHNEYVRYAYLTGIQKGNTSKQPTRS